MMVALIDDDRVQGRHLRKKIVEWPRQDIKYFFLSASQVSHLLPGSSLDTVYEIYRHIAYTYRHSTLTSERLAGVFKIASINFSIKAVHNYASEPQTLPYFVTVFDVYR